MRTNCQNAEETNEAAESNPQSEVGVNTGPSEAAPAEPSSSEQEQDVASGVEEAGQGKVKSPVRGFLS